MYHKLQNKIIMENLTKLKMEIIVLQLLFSIGLHYHKNEHILK